MQRLALIATLALASIGSVAVAQQTSSQPQAAPDSHHQRRTHDPHKMTARMSQRLNLSADQTARLEPILVARKQKMDALRTDQSLTPEARRAQFRALHKETKQQLAGVLTPDQLAQMRSMHHARGRHHGEPMQATNLPSA